VIAQLLVAAVLAGLAVAVALVRRRRQRPDGPTQGPSWAAPSQLDRTDFGRPEAEWLVAVFSSATCTSCAAMVDKAQVLASAAVAVEEVEAVARPDLHRRYGIEAVPIIVVADRAGVVQASFIGPASATDLWAAVAAARGPA
jgi:Thioredoxin